MKLQLAMLLQRSPLSLVNDIYMNNPPPACRNKKLDKTSMFKMFKSDVADQQFSLETAIKNIDKMSSELKKLNVKSQLLLCDLTLNFSHPVKTTVSREVEEKKTDFEELQNSIKFHADASINNSLSH
ncbi:LOW QUALITY PROTEIN: putative uncharacterized protein C5orf58 homolog [Trachemys scripta elegans]|uniref:LOW QUALITY PROTEIN: putative uncharacterized protein C5orf58 homolog n=1 Tax=Trachemys scripta elegans TaxID=31138 RepID=UPI0015517D4A|nr:LOW QUALITY PROTEIN: putative uncharacterized protein C5orf58 homolog [Trachemys scripta elegans]